MDSRLLWLRTRLQISIDSGVLWLGKWAVIIWGGLVVSVFGRDLIDDSEIFYNPRYINFWQDAEAYHLQTDGWKSKSDLVHLYGTNRVEKYIIFYGLSGITIPSEEANLVTSKAMMLCYNDHVPRNGNSNRRRALIECMAITIFIIYLPMVITIRKGQQILAGQLCYSHETCAVSKAYFTEFRWKALIRTVPFSLTIVTILAYINAQFQLTDEMQTRGITSLDITVLLVFVSFLAGVWVLILCSVIDVGFIVFAINPHHSIWDDVLTLAIMAPILVCIYKNSWITVAAAMVTGLATGVVMKWMARQRERAAPPDYSRPVANITEM